MTLPLDWERCEFTQAGRRALHKRTGVKKAAWWGSFYFENAGRSESYVVVGLVEVGFDVDLQAYF